MDYFSNRLTDRFKPFPELVEDEPNAKPYQILDTTGQDWLPTNGMTDKRQRKILVPLSRAGGPVTRHEMAHVRWSPTKIPKVHYDSSIFLAVEDARINLGLVVIDLALILTDDECAYVRKLAAKDLERGDAYSFILRAVASIGTNAMEDALAPAQGGDADHLRAGELATRLVDMVARDFLCGRKRSGGQPVASIPHLMHVSRKLARELEEAGFEQEVSSKRAGILTGHGCCIARGGAEGRSALHEDMRDLMRLRMRGLGIEHIGPGTMNIVEAPLEVITKPSDLGGGRRWTAATEGSVIRSIERYAIDGAIFRRRVRRRGGTVLIDTSGSMSLDVEAVDKIVHAAPGATLIAIYSGRGDHGELRVVARGGRRATKDHLEPFGSGNIVDIPALQWLARQDGPRIWVSDGGVTGCGDISTRKIERTCRDIRERGRVKRVKDSEEAARLLGERRAG